MSYFGCEFPTGCKSYNWDKDKSKTWLHLSLRDRFGDLNLKCTKCQKHIIKDGKPLTLNYYKENQTENYFCKSCAI